MVMKSKKAQTSLVAVMVGIFIFMLSMTFINPISDVIKESRNVENLDCENSSITDGAKMTCLIVDLIMPYFIAIVLAVAGAWVSAKWMGV